AAMGQQVVQIAGALADQVREHLALLLARQIRARGGRSQVELRRIARMSRHGPNPVASRTGNSIAWPGAGVKGFGRHPCDARAARFTYRCSMPGVRYAVLLLTLLAAACGRVTDSEQVRLCRAIIPVLNGAGAEIREIRVAPAALARSSVR